MLNKHTIENSNNDYTSAFQIILQRLGLWDVPTTFDESLSWYQAIKYVLQYLIDKVIPPMQENDTKMNELISYYEEVVDYCNDYFDNLDVQEEINNKLDSMAQSGELTYLIKSYINPYIDNQNQKLIQLQQQINTNSSRIDNFTSLDEGSTTADAELTDIRVTYNGNKYDTAGNAVRTQVSNIYDTINTFATKKQNLFNKNTVKTGNINQVTGEFVEGNYNVTDFIEINNIFPLQFYLQNIITGSYINATAFNIYFYDINFNYISYQTNDLTLPNNAKYIRLRISDNYINNFNIMLINTNDLPIKFIDYGYDIISNTHVTKNKGGNLIISSTNYNSLLNVNTGATSTNNVVGNKTFVTTEYIQLKANKSYTIKNARILCMYSDVLTFVNGLENLIDYTFTPENDIYIRASYDETIDNILIEGTFIPDYDINYNYVFEDDVSFNKKQLELIENISKSVDNLFNKLSNKKIINIGDSIANGDGNNHNGYAHLLANHYNMTLVNYALGGATLGWKNNPSYENQNIITQVNTAINENDNCDIILIDGGTNDSTNNIVDGNITDNYTNNDYDLSTSCGALESIIVSLKNKFSNAIILFIKTHIMGSKPLALRTKLDNLAKVCDKWGINIVDIRQLNTYIDSMAQFTNPTTNKPNGDLTHPNELGYEKFYLPPLKNKLNELL